MLEQGRLSRDDIAASQLPSVQSVMLQPVVGGPDGQDCSFMGNPVRASWPHRHIDNAIAGLVDGNVSAGASPEVQTCADDEDAIGHLSHTGAESSGAQLAGF